MTTERAAPSPRRAIEVIVGYDIFDKAAQSALSDPEPLPFKKKVKPLQIDGQVKPAEMAPADSGTKVA